MSEQQHTQGPWDHLPAETIANIRHGTNWHVGPGGVGGDEVCSVTSENEADARLIAAAPELLAALTELLRVDEEDWDGTLAPEMREARNKAKAAIAKAEGTPVAGPAGGKDDDNER